MGYSIEHSQSKRTSPSNYDFCIYKDSHLIAYYWHDFRGDEHGIEFIDGRSEYCPVGRMIDFIEGGGLNPITLSTRAVAYLKQKQS